VKVQSRSVAAFQGFLEGCLTENLQAHGAAVALAIVGAAASACAGDRFVAVNTLFTPCISRRVHIGWLRLR
jgi:hypothetical protein